MSKQSRFVLVFSALGLVVGGFVAALVQFGDFDSGPELYSSLLLICPPALLCLLSGKLMGNVVGAFILWIFVGVLNAGLYAAVGAAIAGQVWKPEQ